MLPLIGMVVVVTAVLGGYMLESGHLLSLVQPAEGVIIVGAAIGTLIAANSPQQLRCAWAGVVTVFRNPTPTKQFYISTLLMLHSLFEYARRNGATKLEDQLDHPEQFVVFRRHAKAIHDPVTVDFICDTLRLTTLGQVNRFELDELLEQDSDMRERLLRESATTLVMLADALPGLGILSAVLGVVITMNSLREIPKTIGMKVASALVGTFLGIFLSYGFAAPIAAHLERIQEAELIYYQTLRAAIAAFARGLPIAISLEFARRGIPPDLRPGFVELERACRQTSGKIVEMPP